MNYNKFLYHFTKSLLEFMLFGGIIVSALVPVMIYKAVPYLPYLKGIELKLTAVLMISGIMAVYILWGLRRIFKSLVNSNPFNTDNVTILRRIGTAGFIIAAAFLAKCLFWFTLATVIIVIIFAIAGLFCLVLADVFHQAVLYKEENDLTI